MRMNDILKAAIIGVGFAGLGMGIGLKVSPR